LAMKIDYDLQGDEEFRRKLKRFGEKASPKRLVDYVTTWVLDYLKTKAIKQQGRPGTLLTQRSGGSGIIGAIRKAIRKDAGGYKGVIGAGGLKGKILKAHEFGMTIKPQSGRFLVFTPYGASEKVFAKQVRLPARPTFGRTERETKDKIPGVIRGMLSREQRAARL